ncbi:hypothetical protein KBC75_00545 [Candidatus Shapirobacteria bacterium]|nr:hypothetical protein [Candidatus Shapirobacteria bacterium]
MAIQDDFTIDYVNKRLYHSSGTTVYSSNALYTYIMDTFDELAQMDDTVPMSAQTPTDYTLINGWFVDDESFKYLKGGAVKTDGQLNEVRILTLVSGGYTSAISGDIGKTVTGGTTGDTGKLLSYDNTLRKWWVRMDDAGDLFDNASEAITIASGTGEGDMSAISVSGENLWANIYTLGTIEQHSNEEQIYVIQNGTSLVEWWPDSATPAVRHIDVLLKVKEAGTEIDSGKVTVFLRNYPSAGNADLYDNFEIDLTSGGRNAVPLATSPDLNNTTAHATISTYTDISVVFVNATITHGSISSGPYTEFETVTGSLSGATGKFIKESAGTMTLGNVDGTFENNDVLTGGTSGATSTASAGMTVARTTTKNFEQGSSYNYSVIVDCATRALSQVYEYLKYLTRENSSAYYTYGTKYLSSTLSINKLAGEQYITPFIDFDTPTNTYSPTKAAPFGTFAGGKFFGARGVWIQDMAEADIQNFQLIDSDNSTRTPPNKQSITIGNLLSGDRVSVFRTTAGTTINKAMYTAAAGNSSGNATFVVNEAITADTPSTGVIRIVDTSDTSSARETRYTYTSWSVSTFSGVSPVLDRTYTATDDTAYVPFIDETASSSSASVTVIYTTDRSVLLRVRRYTATAILPFETTGTFTSTGYSTSAIRTTDTIVS